MIRKPSRPILVLQYTILILGVLFAVYPLWFAFLASGRAGDRLYTLNLLGMFIPTEWTFENYRAMIFDRPLLTWLRNSLYVAGVTTVASLVITTSAAFAFSRFKFYGREFALILLLAIQTFPGVLSLVAVAQLLTAMGLYGKHEGLILAYTTGTLVFSTWNMKGYFDTIPIELEEAAMIDGCGPIQSFILIALPLARPALAVTALLGFLAGWGDFIFASVLVPAPDSMKLVVPGLFSLANSMSVPWGNFAAGGLLIILPTIIVFLMLQRFLVSGLTVGGVKG
ncbi:sugar ABC transporter permease [Chloroflexus sp.]|uniref:sugar ABC transporter permease n=1 Tax=Chloroflexus sp. TaxID=1904827 RepID=UPI00298F0A18|nr:ABC transporter permease subunit [Chloroflexus sp.]MCS6888146.1 ABC transporter permease subunit [Chloroflexus sp.]MCX7859396.1 ABC transporter permease subunit [Chloroflexus sp.]MDW8403821.1 ABC transporter permease subunit [Chloroflexus sp.]